MKTIFRLILFVSATAVLAKPSSGETYKFDETHSSIGFKIHQYLGVTTGKFKKFSGSIELDREHPENSSVTAHIQVKSIDTGIQKRDNHLRGPDLFNVEKYPEIVFKSHGVKRSGAETGDVIGDLTMHGVTRTITLHVKLLSPAGGETTRTRWSATTEPLKRRDYGLLFGGTTETVSGISQNVEVEIEIEAVRAGN
jgi:polyisoprenoid-binding protein YceI